MKEYIEERVLETSNYIVENNSTVRQCARQFGISKSTVHKDVSERLPQINQRLAVKVREVLDKNKKERHIRGGLATKAKYEKKPNRISKRSWCYRKLYSKTREWGYNKSHFTSAKRTFESFKCIAIRVF